jgi:hypothetical protein
MPALRDYRSARAVMLLAALACGACAPVGNQLPGDQDSQPRVVLIVHRGDADAAQVRRDVQEVVAGAAMEGARLEVYALDSGSAASMSQVPLSDEANGGDLVLTGENRAYRDQEARRYMELVLRDLEPLFDATASSPTGSDVIGAVRFGVMEVHSLRGRGPATVSVITGGGVHRTGALDLVAAKVSPENAAQVAAGIPRLDIPSDVVVELRGVGRFEGAIPPVDPQFAAGVRVFWEELCRDCALH